MKFIECHNIEEQLIRQMEEDLEQERREAWAREFLAEMRAQDSIGEA